MIGTRPEAIKLAPLVLELARTEGLRAGGRADRAASGNGRPGARPLRDPGAPRLGHPPSGSDPHRRHRARPRRPRVGPASRPARRFDRAGRHDHRLRRGTGCVLPGHSRAHVEAGLRTGDPRSPFPEEINRRLIAPLTAVHLAPTASSAANLHREAVAPETVFVTGNTVIDALLWTVERRVDYGDPALAGLDDDPRRVLLVTAHRRESWGEPMRAIGAALGTLARNDPELLVVFPIHRNPLVREAILPAVEGLANVVIIEPLAYGAFARLMARADVILTDSGGVQEEGPTLGKPVLVMRDNTERPEAVEAGTARLIGTDDGAIVEWVRRLLDDPVAYAEMTNAVNRTGTDRPLGASPRRCASSSARANGPTPSWPAGTDGRQAFKPLRSKAGPTAIASALVAAMLDIIGQL